MIKPAPAREHVACSDTVRRAGAPPPLLPALAGANAAGGGLQKRAWDSPWTRCQAVGSLLYGDTGAVGDYWRTKAIPKPLSLLMPAP